MNSTAVRRFNTAAKTHLSTSIDHFEDAGRPEVKKPVVVKQSAIEGLIKESNGEFKQAQKDYQEAARDLDDEDAEIYEVWAQLTEVKYHLSNGDYETAINTCKSISGGNLEYNLVDLRKLNVLTELLEALENDNISDGSTVFGKAEMPGSPGKTTSDFGIKRDLLVQYETDYSSAYSVLLSKQQLRKLGRDSVDEEALRSAIVDGITPLGNESNPPKKPNSDTSNKVGVSHEESTSGLAKTQERSRDQTFDALDQENDEAITYESQVSDIQQGRDLHEKALDRLENYLNEHGFKGGETNRSDFIATNEQSVLLIEAKHISPNKEDTQIRKAVGQLLEYRYRDVLQDDEFAELDLTLWLLLSQSPSDSFIPILDSFQDKGIYTLWIDDTDIGGLEESLTKLDQILNEHQN